jgi:hypothetical protein
MCYYGYMLTSTTIDYVHLEHLRNEYNDSLSHGWNGPHTQTSQNVLAQLLMEPCLVRWEQFWTPSLQQKTLVNHSFNPFSFVDEKEASHE